MLSWSSRKAQQRKLIENSKEKSRGWKALRASSRWHTIMLISSVELPLLACLFLTSALRWRESITAVIEGIQQLEVISINREVCVTVDYLTILLFINKHCMGIDNKVEGDALPFQLVSITDVSYLAFLSVFALLPLSCVFIVDFVQAS